MCLFTMPPKRRRISGREKSPAGLEVRPAPFAAAGVRAALSARVAHGAAATFWHGNAFASDVSADAFICGLGRHIAAALERVREAGEAAQATLVTTRAALHAAVDSRCDELESGIHSVTASKTTALELELVSVDAALERWRAESGAVRDAVSMLSDTELEEHHAMFDFRLKSMESELQRLPTAVVEPPFVGLLADTPALLSSIAGFGRVLAPLAITASDLSFVGVPKRMLPGNTLCLRLSLGARHEAQSAEELVVSLDRLAEAACVKAMLEGPDVEPQPLQTSFAPDIAQCCVIVSIDVHSTASSDASVNVIAVSVAGQPVPGVPICVPVRIGITAPLVLQYTTSSGYYTTPCIFPDGRIYCPPGNGLEVLVFDADGSPLPGLPVTGLGLSEHTAWSAYSPGEVPSLLLGVFMGASRLVAVDPATRAVRWASAEGSIDGCYGIAMLPSLGIAVVNTCGLSAHRISDGVRVGSLAAPRLDFFMVADDSAGAVYGTVACTRGYDVHAWSVTADGAGIRITSNAPVTAAGTGTYSRPLAVVPPAPGKRVSHLVVGTGKSSELLVLSLPGLALVHTHSLEGMEVGGLAADPWGGALAVCDDKSKSCHVLAWPLPGMPPLE